jgi:hypothetical protein
MHITDEQRAIFETWLRKKAADGECPVCHARRWSIDDEVIVVHPADPLDEAAAPAPGLLQLVCDNCGRVEFFSVRHIADWHAGEEASRALVM